MCVAAALLLSIYSTVMKYLVPDDDHVDIVMVLAVMDWLTFSALDRSSDSALLKSGRACSAVCY